MSAVSVSSVSSAFSDFGHIELPEFRAETVQNTLTCTNTTLRFAALQLHCVSRCKTCRSSTKVGRRGHRVESPSVWRMVIIAAAADWRKPGRLGTFRWQDFLRELQDARALLRGPVHVPGNPRAACCRRRAGARSGSTASRSNSDFVGDRAKQRKADASPLPGSRARIRDTPAIGRIPRSCERVQASPKRSPNAASMTPMTASMSSEVAGCDVHLLLDRLPSRRLRDARVGRAGIDGLGRQ